MDSERFGRALGFGARAAAKTLVTAVDAASSPNPKKPAASAAKPGAAANTASGASTASSASTASRSASSAEAVGVKTERVVEQVSRAAAQVMQTSQGLNQQGRQLQKSVLSPVKRLSGVLWLEFTGFFFGLFSVSAGSAVWKLRDALHETPQNHDTHVKLLVAAGTCLLFAYFCVSSFVRAKRRERGR